MIADLPLARPGGTTRQVRDVATVIEAVVLQELARFCFMYGPNKEQVYFFSGMVCIRINADMGPRTTKMSHFLRSPQFDGLLLRRPRYGE